MFVVVTAADHFCKQGAQASVGWGPPTWCSTLRRLRRTAVDLWDLVQLGLSMGITWYNKGCFLQKFGHDPWNCGMDAYISTNKWNSTLK